MGTLIYQDPKSGQRSMIAYASAKFNRAESRYHCNEQEFLVVMYEIKRFRQYLEDQSITLRTDSHLLIWLDLFKDTRDKLAHWALLLQEFSFNEKHCPGNRISLPTSFLGTP